MAQDVLFPHPNMRKIQDGMVKDIYNAISLKKDIIVHAPTGLGKTAASLGPALTYALKNDLTVFFLTSRHTQHRIAVETLEGIKKKHNVDFTSCDLIGKQWMCLVPGASKLYSNEFHEFCRSEVENYRCEFYVKAKKRTGKPTVEAEKALEELKQKGPQHTEQIIAFCNQERLCPYEMATLLAEHARVIIADYYYIFHPSIRQALFQRAKKELGKCIIIVDEGHNLPKRCRELLTQRLTTITVDRAIKEAEKFKEDEIREHLAGLRDIFLNYADELEKEGISKEETNVKKEDFVKKINELRNFDELTTELQFAGDEIRKKQKQSYIGSIAEFLGRWTGQDHGYARIFSRNVAKRHFFTLSYRCLDPSLITKAVIEEAYSTIIMSGTLTPTSMYRDILGFDGAIEKEYPSPFPKHNRLSLIVPETTTKFTERNETQFKRIAAYCANMVNSIPGNSAIFFPSYFLRDKINSHFEVLCEKTIFLEKPGLTKEQKQEMLERFKSYKDEGAALLGAATGSFGEGIDLMGDYLKAVIVVGLPLEKPNLETGALIDYYDRKFGKGWDYGYVLPAITRTLQNAGRCIRSETDKGVIIFLDERYAWPRYYKCFPKEMDVSISQHYPEKIRQFFSN